MHGIDTECWIMSKVWDAHMRVLSWRRQRWSLQRGSKNTLVADRWIRFEHAELAQAASEHPERQPRTPWWQLPPSWKMPSLWRSWA